MRSKRSRQHAARRIAKRVAEMLMDRPAFGDAGPIYRTVEARMKSAYTTLGTHLALSMYASEHG